MSQLSLSDLNACSNDDFVAALANIFEYSPDAYSSNRKLAFASVWCDCDPI